jgi:hypothetical protein
MELIAFLTDDVIIQRSCNLLPLVINAPISLAYPQEKKWEASCYIMHALRGMPMPNDIRWFILHSLQLEPAPPVPIIVECLFIIGFILGIELHVDDLLVTNEK